MGTAHTTNFRQGLAHVAPIISDEVGRQELANFAQRLNADVQRIRKQPIRKLSPALYALQYHSSDETDVAMALGAAFRTQMAAGMTGNLPSTTRSAGGKRQLSEDKAFIEVGEALDQVAAFEAFAEVIKYSTCPLVAGLRQAMEAAYVQNNLGMVCEAVGIVDPDEGAE